MARRTFISDLPKDVREEVNLRLREALYGGQIELTEWLNAQGYKASKSGVNRYAMALRKADGFQRTDQSHDMMAKGIFDSKLSRRESLIMELGELKLREISILDELNKISG